MQLRQRMEQLRQQAARMRVQAASESVAAAAWRAESIRVASALAADVALLRDKFSQPLPDIVPNPPVYGPIALPVCRPVAPFEARLLLEESANDDAAHVRVCRPVHFSLLVRATTAAAAAAAASGAGGVPARLPSPAATGTATTSPNTNASSPPGGMGGKPYVQQLMLRVDVDSADWMILGFHERLVRFAGPRPVHVGVSVVPLRRGALPLPRIGLYRTHDGVEMALDLVVFRSAVVVV
jgi:hypothetical protein